MVRKLTGEQIWLLLAESGKPMSTEEIAKTFGARKENVQEILEQEVGRFCRTEDGRWNLAFYHYIRPNHTLEEIAEFVLCCAWFPLPDTIFFLLLKRLCPEIPESEIRQRIKESSKFVFNGLWQLSWWKYFLGVEEEKIIWQLIIDKRSKATDLLQKTKKPIHLDELIHAIDLEGELERHAEINQWSPMIRHLAFVRVYSYFWQLVKEIEGVIILPSGRWIAISQEQLQTVVETLQETQAGFTTEEILQSVLQIQAEPIEQTELLKHLEQLLRKDERVECINGKWFAKLPSFVSCYTFYDPETFVAVVEKGEHIDFGSSKEQWLRDKGFYVLARLGGEADAISK